MMVVGMKVEEDDTHGILFIKSMIINMSEWVLAIVVRKLLCVCDISLRALPPHVFLYEWVCVRQVMLHYCPLIEDGVHSSNVFSHVSVSGYTS